MIRPAPEFADSSVKVSVKGTAGANTVQTQALHAHGHESRGFMFITTRTWQQVMDEIPKLKQGSTKVRWLSAIKILPSTHCASWNRSISCCISLLAFNLKERGFGSALKIPHRSHRDVSKLESFHSKPFGREYGRQF